MYKGDPLLWTHVQKMDHQIQNNPKYFFGICCPTNQQITQVYYKAFTLSIYISQQYTGTYKQNFKILPKFLNFEIS